ncbi:MAG: hypothetical protein ACRYGK_10180 [Janthinobacterium lividum]
MLHLRKMISHRHRIGRGATTFPFGHCRGKPCQHALQNDRRLLQSCLQQCQPLLATLAGSHRGETQVHHIRQGMKIVEYAVRAYGKVCSLHGLQGKAMVEQFNKRGDSSLDFIARQIDLPRCRRRYLIQRNPGRP